MLFKVKNILRIIYIRNLGGKIKMKKIKGLVMAGLAVATIGLCASCAGSEQLSGKALAEEVYSTQLEPIAVYDSALQDRIPMGIEIDNEVYHVMVQGKDFYIPSSNARVLFDDYNHSVVKDYGSFAELIFYVEWVSHLNGSGK